MKYQLGKTIWNEKKGLFGSRAVFQSEQVVADMYELELLEMGAIPIEDEPEEMYPPELIWSKNATNELGTLETVQEFIDWATQITKDHNDLLKRVKKLESDPMRSLGSTYVNGGEK